MEKVLEIKELKKVFYKNKVPYVAVDHISFQLYKGECLGLVGESGCGKSTTAKLITRLLEADEGEILFNGVAIEKLKGRKLRDIYREVQMVFQSPKDSFDPRCTLGNGIMESMINFGMPKKKAKGRMLELLKLVELEDEIADRYPHEISGGQCQRAAIARALGSGPKLIICDEATSALDVIVQAQIVDLLKKLQKEIGLSLLFICHDLAVVQHFCDRVLVMQRGRLVESGKTDEVIQYPKDPYTKLLIDSSF